MIYISSCSPVVAIASVWVEIGDESQPEEEFFAKVLSAVCLHEILQPLRDKSKRVAPGLGPVGGIHQTSRYKGERKPRSSVDSAGESILGRDTVQPRNSVSAANRYQTGGGNQPGERSSKQSVADLVCWRALAQGSGWHVSILRIADTFPKWFAVMSAVLRPGAAAQSRPLGNRRHVVDSFSVKLAR